MPDGWSDYYVLIGTAAATLIGLMFVVTTLMTGREAEEVERGKRIYTSPVVWKFIAVLALSGLALMPSINLRMFGFVGAAVGLAGAGLSTWIALRIGKSNAPSSTRIFDFWWYGVGAGLSYASMLAASVALLMDMAWALTVMGIAQMVMLLVAVHNAWDLVTFLAPRAEKDATAATAPGQGD